MTESWRINDEYTGLRQDYNPLFLCKLFTVSSTALRLMYEKKEEIWLSPMTKFPTLTENSKMLRDNIKNATKTPITQRLQTD